MFSCLRCREVNDGEGYSFVVQKQNNETRKPERVYALEFFCEPCLHKLERELEVVLTSQAMHAANDAKACKRLFLASQKEQETRSKEERGKW